VGVRKGCAKAVNTEGPTGPEGINGSSLLSGLVASPDRGADACNEWPGVVSTEFPATFNHSEASNQDKGCIDGGYGD